MLILVFQACYKLVCEVLLIQVLLSCLLTCGLRLSISEFQEEFHTENYLYLVLYSADLDFMVF